MLLSVNATYIDVYNGWIYYVKNNSELWKVKKDGSSNTKLTSGNFARGIKAVNNYIFYFEQVTGGYIIKRINNDGTNNIAIGHSSFVRPSGTPDERKKNYGSLVLNNFALTDNYIYYNSGKIINKCDLSGNNSTKIYSINDDYVNPSISLSVSQNYIYYSMYYSYKSTVYRINLDGSNLVKIFEKINTDQSQVLFTNRDFCYIGEMGLTRRVEHGQIMPANPDSFNCTWKYAVAGDSNYMYEAGILNPGCYIYRNDINSSNRVRIL